MIRFQSVLPEEIEKRSFEMIAQELGDRTLAPENQLVIKRVIHTTADFDYCDNLVFSPGAVAAGIRALREGATIVTDTNMAHAGINKRVLEKLGGRAVCHMADPEVAARAKEEGTTRAVASMDRAAAIEGPVIFAIGNAPTALIRLCELMEAGKIAPRLIIGAPVGFVNAAESKELLLLQQVPQIVARGRKGGSNVAAAICNALLYQVQQP